MNIFYNDNTLYITLLDIDKIDILKKRVFNILDDYDIENIILSVSSKDNLIINSFINDYKKKYNGNLSIKKI